MMNTSSRTSHEQRLRRLTALAAIAMAIGMVAPAVALVTTGVGALEGSLSGTVTDASTGEAVENALVTLRYHEITRTDRTDAEGKYSFENVPLCYCLKNLSASKDGYEDWSEDVAVGADTVVDIALEPGEGTEPSPSGTLTGTVTDADTGRPIEGVLMTLSYHEVVRTTRTGPDGTYTFTGVPICFCLKSLTAHKDGYVDQSTDVAVDETTVVDLALEPSEPGAEPETGTLAGVVTDADTGEPIEGAAVSIEFHGTTESDITDTEGRYLITGVPICRCLKNVTVEKDGYVALSALVGVGEGTVKDFELVPEEAGPDGGTIAGTVTDADTDEPIEGVKVTVSYHETVRTTTTDSDGRYAVTGVPECFCLKEVKVSMNGYHGQSKSVGVYGTTVVDFALQPRDSGGDGSSNGVTGGEVAAGMTGQQLAVTGLLGGVLILVVLVVYMVTVRRKQEL